MALDKSSAYTFDIEVGDLFTHFTQSGGMYTDYRLPILPWRFPRYLFKSAIEI